MSLREECFSSAFHIIVAICHILLYMCCVCTMHIVSNNILGNTGAIFLLAIWHSHKSRMKEARRLGFCCIPFVSVFKWMQQGWHKQHPSILSTASCHRVAGYKEQAKYRQACARDTRKNKVDGILASAPYADIPKSLHWNDTNERGNTDESRSCNIKTNENYYRSVPPDYLLLLGFFYALK